MEKVVKERFEALKSKSKELETKVNALVSEFEKENNVVCMFDKVHTSSNRSLVKVVMLIDLDTLTD
jgi:hypothetical protein